MNWTQSVDGYCERLDAGLWSEPLNAVSNLAFILVALVMWTRSGGVAGARGLSLIEGVIGAGSLLFHTFATTWAAMADVVPIAVFILTYLFLTNRGPLGLGVWTAAGATLLFLPFAAGVVAVTSRLPFFEVSGFYWSVPLLLVLYALAFRSRLGAVMARGFWIGAGLLSVSITLRSLDETLCPVWPYGTHFAWHLLNGVMLGWMIEVYRVHMLAAKGRQG